MQDDTPNTDEAPLRVTIQFDIGDLSKGATPDRYVERFGDKLTSILQRSC